MYKRLLLALLIGVLGITGLIQAQDITPTGNTDFDPNAAITWPPPVYVLRGEVDIRGSANLSNMTSYFVEFRPLELLEFDPDVTQPVPTATPTETDEEEPSWFPVSLPSNESVQDNVLASWDTETTNDGLYEIRLTVNVSGQGPVHFVVSPLRVENNPPDFVIIDDDDDEAPARPTLAASPTPVDTTPVVTSDVNANVRAGDSTDYQVVAILSAGTTARVVGISSTGSGWYVIELDNGDRGFIAPSVVDVSGDLRGLPRINPPPPPFTPTPVPTSTPIPTGNLAGSTPDLNPDTPTCDVEFEVLVNVTNNGSARTGSEAIVLIQDVHVASGQVQQSFTRTVPVLEPGANFVVGGSLRITTFFNEQHRIVVTLDVNNTIAETNENDNVLTTTYTLQQGGC